MFTAHEVIQPGYYWYYAASGAPPVVVEVYGPSREQFKVRMPDQAREQDLRALSGSFHGPIPPPLKRGTRRN